MFYLPFFISLYLNMGYDYYEVKGNSLLLIINTPHGSLITYREFDIRNGVIVGHRGVTRFEDLIRKRLTKKVINNLWNLKMIMENRTAPEKHSIYGWLSFPLPENEVLEILRKEGMIK